MKEISSFLKLVAVSCCILFLCIAQGRAQENIDSTQNEKLWRFIETELSTPQVDQNYSFISTLVKSKCEGDYDCLFSTYDFLIFKLEKAFMLRIAVPVTLELAVLAKKNKKEKDEAYAYSHLDRFYSALGNEEDAAKYNDLAEKLNIKLKNYRAVFISKMNKLEAEYQRSNSDSIFTKINQLLNESKLYKSKRSTTFIHTRLLYLCISSQRYEEALYHLEEIEKVPISDPIKQNEYGLVIIATKARGDLAVINGDYEEAIKQYNINLEYCAAEPSRWVEISTLQSLADLELKRQNIAEAQEYAEQAISKAKALNVTELISYSYGQKSRIAESINNYQEALASYKESLHYKDLYEAKSAGFDIRNFQLKQQNQLLEEEQKIKDLELELNRSSLRSNYFISAMALLTVLVLVVVYYRERRSRQVLSTQNEVIGKQTAELKEIDTVKSKFFANVSHELRTPLTLILGPIKSLLKDENLNDKQKQKLEMVHRNGLQLEGLVTDILDLSKLSKGKMDINSKPVEVGAYFRQYLPQYESLAHYQQIKYRYKIDIPDDLIGDLDLSKVRQMLNNLLSNAFKYTTKNQTIQAIVRYYEGVLVMQVGNVGAKIPDEDLPYVFDRYFQSVKAQNKAEGGTGIGLALCKEYTELLGGTIEVVSEDPNRDGTVNTIFTVQIPLKESTKTVGINTRTPSSNAEKLKQNKDKLRNSSHREESEWKPRILIVEDNRDIQEHLVSLLEEKYQVFSALNGQEAIDLEEGLASMDMILCDIMMPVMDGFELLSYVKSTPHTWHIPIIMLTARAAAFDKIRALRVGVDDYLIKPFIEEELMTRIENLLLNYSNRSSSTEHIDTSNMELLSEQDQIWLMKFEKYLKENIKEAGTIPMIAEEFEMSESTLLRELKRITGLTPTKYINEIRMDIAVRALQSGEYSNIGELSVDIGFSSVQSFSRNFKARFGRLPSDYLR